MKELVKLKIESLDYKGLGVAKQNNLIYFVENALPNEEIIAKINRKTKKIAFGKTSKVIESSTHRVIPKCKHYFECGGCELMHMDYGFQLEFKRKKVEDAFKHIAKMDVKVQNTMPSPNIYEYRNKISMPFQDNGQIIFGFYQSDSHISFDMEECYLEKKYILDILNIIKESLIKNRITIYQDSSKKGIFKEAVFRVNKKNEVMLTLVVTKESNEFNAVLEDLKRYSYIKSLYLNINDMDNNVILGKTFIHVFGDQYLEEEILNTKLLVGPNSFMQVNIEQAENLYKYALNLLDYSNMHVIDAYCGIGSITLNLAKKAKYVYGIEVVDEAVSLAKNNAILNKLNNVDFLLGKCEDEIKKLVAYKNIDLIVFDPPRKGCDKEFLDTVIEMKIPNIIYISCEVSTCARDIEYLSKFYSIIEIQPFDMFPNTSHVETVVLLERK